MSDFTQPFRPISCAGAATVGNIGSAFADWAGVAGVQYISTSTTWTTANQAVYQAFTVQDPITVTHLMVFVATAAGNIDVGIYTESGTRIVSSGSTAVSGSSAIQSFDITDTTLTPGVYWLACACSSTSAVLRTSTGNVAAGNSATAPARGVMVEASALPLPATATFAKPAISLVACPAISASVRTTF